jgi:hypothetical protein
MKKWLEDPEAFGTSAFLSFARMRIVCAGEFFATNRPYLRFRPPHAVEPSCAARLRGLFSKYQ